MLLIWLLVGPIVAFIIVGAWNTRMTPVEKARINEGY